MIINQSLAHGLAWAIQKFRNAPLLGEADALRATPEFSELCGAWERYVAAYPNARLQGPVLDAIRNPRRGISVFVTNDPHPFTVTADRRARKMVYESLEKHGSSGLSSSGKTLAFAVDYCEERRLPYKITAYPGAGYSLEIIKEEFHQ